MNLRLLALLTVLLAVCFIGCEDSSEELLCPHLDQMSDEEKLFLADCFPIGLSYQEVKVRVPSVSELRDEVSFPPYSGVLEEADAQTEAYGLTADIEFNFRDKQLYSYYLVVSPPDTVASDSLYSGLQGSLSERYGQVYEEVSQENTYTYAGSYWCQNDALGVLLGKRVEHSGSSEVSWGYQNRCP